MAEDTCVGMSLHPFAAEVQQRLMQALPRLQPCVSRPHPASSYSDLLIQPTHPTYSILRWLRVGRLDCPECKLGVRSRRAFARDERVDCLVTELLTSFSADPADLTEEQVGGHSP